MQYTGPRTVQESGTKDAEEAGMKRILARTGRGVAALAAGALLAGCHFAVVPPKKNAAASPSPTASANARANATASAGLRDPYAARLADAPPLLIQCLVDQSGLRPGTGLDWFSGGKVTINTTNATDFNTWWQSHDKPGPYAQAFRVAGHLTHYLEFGTPWVKQGSLWIPAHTGNANPKALQYSLIAWANWTAVNDKLPPEVCGASLTVQQLQDAVFGNSTPSPW